MADVFRFVLSTNRSLEVPGVGKFRLGVLDVPADDGDAVSRARYRLDPYDVTEVGVIDEDTPIPVLPELPTDPMPSPDVRYFTNLDLLDPDSVAMSAILAAVADLGLSVPDATEVVKGVVALATAAEAVDGTDAVRAITPASLAAVIDAVTADTLGLGNVDNTSDVDKPVSTAQQAALDARAPIDSPTFTGTVAGVTKAMVGLDQVDNTADANKPISIAAATEINLKAYVSRVERIINHDGTAAGGTRPSGYARCRWVGGTTRPTNMVTGDIWEHDAP